MSCHSFCALSSKSACSGSGLGADMLLLLLMIMLMLMLRPGGGHVEGDQGETGEESQRDTTAKVESHDDDKSENKAFDV